MADVLHVSPGQPIRAIGVFTDINGTLYNPTDPVTGEIVDNTGAVSTIASGAIAHDSLGTYHFTVMTPLTGSSGPWAFRLIATGGAVDDTAGLQYAVVDDSPFG